MRSRSGKLQNSIIIANKEYIEECYKMLMSSDLGKTYFSNKDPYKILLRALENEEIFIALSNDKRCLGFIWVELNGTFGKYPYLHMIIVGEKFRGQGIGKILIAHFENVITSGYDKVFLMVGDFNDRAKRLYHKLGYKVIGELPSFYVNGVEESLMCKMKEKPAVNGDCRSEGG